MAELLCWVWPASSTNGFYDEVRGDSFARSDIEVNGASRGTGSYGGSHSLASLVRGFPTRETLAGDSDKPQEDPKYGTHAEICAARRNSLAAIQPFLRSDPIPLQAKPVAL